MKRDRLVVLEYDFTSGYFDLKWLDGFEAGKYITVHGVEKEKLRVSGDVWDYEVWRGNRIGDRRDFQDPYAPGMVFGGVIGIYDLNNAEHKKKINRDLKEAWKTYRRMKDGCDKG